MHIHLKRGARRVFFGIFSVIVLLYALIWIAGIRKSAVTFGVHFSPTYATSLGLDWREAYEALLYDLKPPLLRIAAPWSEIEETEGVYDWTHLDWMMSEAGRADASVLLVVGQKVPRWPECYYPAWADTHTLETQERFYAYVEAVVMRYRDQPALAAWQVENEPFIRFPFGECAKYQESWVAEEIERVHLLDPGKSIVVTDSGELGLWHKTARAGDVLGTTVYRFVKTPSGRTWSYFWLPAGWYRIRARFLGKSMNEFIISELQAEPWGDSDFPLERLLSHAAYARHTGASQAYLWGAEWWYLRKLQGDARYWEAARILFSR